MPYPKDPNEVARMLINESPVGHSSGLYMPRLNWFDSGAFGIVGDYSDGSKIYYFGANQSDKHGFCVIVSPTKGPRKICGQALSNRTSDLHLELFYMSEWTHPKITLEDKAEYLKYMGDDLKQYIATASKITKIYSEIVGIFRQFKEEQAKEEQEVVEIDDIFAADRRGTTGGECAHYDTLLVPGMAEVMQNRNSDNTEHKAFRDYLMRVRPDYLNNLVRTYNNVVAVEMGEAAEELLRICGG